MISSSLPTTLYPCWPRPVRAGSPDAMNGRGERIRTSDTCVPNAVLYQAELHPVKPAYLRIPGTSRGPGIRWRPLLVPGDWILDAP